MAFTAEQAARNAANDRVNAPGMCLQQTRIWAGISARYPDASTAWRNTNDKHTDRNPPRGSAVYWTGGSSGHGHIALSLGGGKVRSTDSGGRGKVATVELGWVERNWGLRYAGWAWDINEQTIQHQAAKPKEEPKTEPKKDVDTHWERVRAQLLAALNSDDAGKVKRKKIKKFLKNTEERIGELPKE